MARHTEFPVAVRGADERLKRRTSIVLDKRTEAEEAISNAVIALQKIAAELAAQDYQGKDPDKIARTGAYLAKIVDETVRLIEYLDGNPDSRPDLGLGDMLKYLTAEQFQQFSKWIEDGKNREIMVN